MVILIIVKNNGEWGCWASLDPLWTTALTLHCRLRKDREVPSATDSDICGLETSATTGLSFPPPSYRITHLYDQVIKICTIIYLSIYLIVFFFMQRLVSFNCALTFFLLWAAMTREFLAICCATILDSCFIRLNEHQCVSVVKCANVQSNFTIYSCLLICLQR